MSNLTCLWHQDPILFINSSRELSEKNYRPKCGQCIKEGDKFVHITEFESSWKEKKPEYEQLVNQLMDKFSILSKPLQKLLENYKDEFDSKIQDTQQEIERVKNSIYEFYKPVLNYNPDYTSLDELHKTSNLIYSQVEFNLKSKYFQIIDCIKKLIKVHQYYGYRIQKCFAQLQDDLANYENSFNINVDAQTKVCNAMAISKDSDVYLLALALGNVVKTYEIKSENKEYIQRQEFKHHTHNITTLIFSEDDKYFISGGSYDYIMNIYVTKDKNFYQLIAQVTHQESINSIIFTPNNEEIISASGNDLYLLSKYKLEEMTKDGKFNDRNPKHINYTENASDYQLNHSHDNTIYQLSYNINDIHNLFLSCSFDKQILIWEKQYDKSSDDQWKIINKIKVQHPVYRCCFTGEDSIVVQESSTRELTFYDFVSQKTQCKKNNQKTVRFNDLNTDLSFSFPLIFIATQQLLIAKHNKKIFFLKQRKDGKLYKEDEKNGEMGTISSNGQIFLMWNKTNQHIELMIQQKNKDFEKNQLDEKCFETEIKEINQSIAKRPEQPEEKCDEKLAEKQDQQLYHKSDQKLDEKITSQQDVEGKIMKVDEDTQKINYNDDTLKSKQENIENLYDADDDYQSGLVQF